MKVMPQRQLDVPPDGGGVGVYGHCVAHRSIIRAGFEQEDWRRLLTLPGNYCLASRSGTVVTLVGSAIAPPNLFYLQLDGRLVYASSAVDVARLAGVPWRWNWSALADVAALEHCVDGDSLHADIRKLRPGEVVQFDGTRLHSWQMPWNERMACADPSPEAAVSALRTACKLSADRDVVVSMSAGFDSRLLLACLMASGVKPRLITMGHPDSTDARISEAIARQFGLQLSLVSLDPEDYLKHASAIGRISGGSKTFQNWHTYLYAKNASLTTGSRLFIGANGEAARSYYLDKGIAALAADRLASARARAGFWRVKSRPIFETDEIAALHSALATELSAPRSGARLKRLCDLSSGALLSGLDRFYTEQRVANFIANGLGLVAAHVAPAAPMLDLTWTAQVWNLPRHWKMDSKWHRFAIAKTCPELLQFDEERTGRSMRGKPSRLYWVPRGQRRASKPYMDYAQLSRSSMIMRLIEEKWHWIEPVAQPALPRLVFARHASGSNRLRAASFLLTMLLFVECLGEAGIGIADDLRPRRT